MSRSFSEYLAMPAASAPSQSLAAAATLQSGYVDRTKIQRVIFLLNVGAMVAGAKLDMKLQESDDHITYTDVVPSQAITQLLAAGGDNRQASIEATCDWTGFTKRYIAVLVTATTQASLVGVQALGIIRGLKQATALDDTTVAQRLVVPARPPSVS